MTDGALSWATKHAMARAIERLGFEPTEANWRGAVLAIIEGRALLRRKCQKSNGAITYDYIVRLGEKESAVVYDPEKAKIVTVIGTPFTRVSRQQSTIIRRFVALTAKDGRVRRDRTGAARRRKQIDRAKRQTDEEDHP